MSNFQVSSQRNPCLVCGRTKDKDCRISEDEGLVLCHTERNGRKPGEEFNGFIYLGEITDGAGWGKWLLKSGEFKKERTPGQEFRYQFTDTEGNLLVEEVRIYQATGDKKTWMEPKGVDTAKLAPYRYIEAIQSLKDGAAKCFICEGPPKADALWELGISAVAFANGFKANRDSHWFEGFEDRLIVAADRDKPGLEKAEKVLKAYPLAKLLKPCPESAYWEPEFIAHGGGFDIKDWIEQLKREGLDSEKIQAKLWAAVEAPQATQAPGEQPAEGKAKKGPPVFKLLMEIAENCDLWHSDDGVAYADLEIEGIRHTYPIRRKAFKTWLSSELYKRHETGANSEAMASCLNVLEAKATFEGQGRKVFLRTGQDADGTVYIDAATQAWDVIKVTAAGWEVIASKDCPIRFSRNEGQLPLPLPEHGGDLSKLWDVVAVNKNYRGLVLAWLAFCFVPNGSKPILTFHGAKGAGKSWATQVLKSLIDPGKAALLPAVGDRRGLAVAASNRWVLSYDNLTTLSTDQQDALCCAATGAGFSHRTLHTDLDETFIEYTRPQILTSVDLVPTRSDLLDRCLLIKLDRIPDNERKTEAELKETLAALSPGLLGALLDVVAGTLGTWGTEFNRGHNEQKLPRLADFGLFAIKAETALGLESGGFMATYQANIEAAQNEAIEANPIAAAILALMEQQTQFDGTASDLVAKLKTVSEDAKVQKLSARTLGKTLSGSLKQDLEAVGIECDNYRVPGGKRERKWLIYQSEDARPDKQPYLMSQTSQTSRQDLEPSHSNGFSPGHEAGHQTEIRDIKTLNVPQTSLNVPPNVPNVPTLEPSHSNGFENDRDMRDVWDMKKSYLSGVTSSDDWEGIE